MAHRDAAHENQITPIHIHSVEWSDRSEPVQKLTFLVLMFITNATRFATVRARWSVWVLHSPLTWLFQCGGFLAKLIIFLQYSAGNVIKFLFIISLIHYLCSRKPPHWKSHVNGLCRTQTDQHALTVANRVAFVMNIRTRKVSFCTGSERSDHSTECICIGVIWFSCAASL